MIDSCLSEIQLAVKILIDSVSNGSKIIWCGNGGSAADAQHMSAELMGGLRSHKRPAIASIALTTDASFITAWANDTSYDLIFSRQIEGLALPGDVLIAISTSGNSENIIQAIKAAKNKHLKVIILLGKLGGKMLGLGDAEIIIPSDDTQRIQEAHLLVEHILCESLEASVMGF